VHSFLELAKKGERYKKNIGNHERVVV